MVGIGEDVEDISEQVGEVLLEELVRDFWGCAGKVVDQVKGDYMISHMTRSLLVGIRTA